MTPPPSRIRLNRRGLVQIVLICACLTLLTLTAWHQWQTNGGHVSALDHSQALTLNDALVSRIVQHPGVISSAALIEFALLLALFLGIAPPRWWLRTDRPRLEGESEVVDTPLKWLGEKLTGLQPPPAVVPVPPGDPAALPADPTLTQTPGLPTALAQTQPAVAQPGAVPPAAGQPAPGQPEPGQPVPGQPAPGQSQPLIVQPVTAATTPGTTPDGQPAPGASPTAQAPGAPPPPAPPLSDVLQFTEEETDPLADLADLKDILSSAFDEDSALDPDREALSRTLDEVSVHGLTTLARTVSARFRQSETPQAAYA